MIHNNIQKIIDNPITLTNKVLYEICQDKGKYSWGNNQFLGEKIWLIGRSYAASPERRYKKNNRAPKKLKQNNPGNGTGKYFSEVGKHIVKDSRYTILVSKNKALQNGYVFDGSNNDIILLESVIETVGLFNEMIKDASKYYDQRYNPNLSGYVDYKNQISFCSKFLHFHYPHSVFIFDNFTKNNANGLFSLKSGKQLHIEGDNIEINLKMQLQSYIPSLLQNPPAEVKDYAEHCIKSYALCCFIKNSGLFNTKNIVYHPRTSDSILQLIK